MSVCVRGTRSHREERPVLRTEAAAPPAHALVREHGLAARCARELAGSDQAHVERPRDDDGVQHVQRVVFPYDVVEHPTKLRAAELGARGPEVLGDTGHVHLQIHHVLVEGRFVQLGGVVGFPGVVRHAPAEGVGLNQLFDSQQDCVALRRVRRLCGWDGATSVRFGSWEEGGGAGRAGLLGALTSVCGRGQPIATGTWSYRMWKLDVASVRSRMGTAVFGKVVRQIPCMYATVCSASCVGAVNSAIDLTLWVEGRLW